MSKNKEEQIKELLNKNIDKIKDYAVQVNKGKSFFNKEDFNTIEGVPIYFEPDEYGRTKGQWQLSVKYTINKN